MAAMDALDRLESKLTSHPELQWQRESGRICIEAPRLGGFAVELHFSGDEWTVYLGLGTWHEHFLDEEEALNFVAWCYSGEARLREIRRGSVLTKSVLEARNGETWERVSEVGYLSFAFWRQKSEIVRQNPNLLR